MTYTLHNDDDDEEREKICTMVIDTQFDKPTRMQRDDVRQN